jgi:transaldolase
MISHDEALGIKRAKMMRSEARQSGFLVKIPEEWDSMSDEASRVMIERMKVFGMTFVRTVTGSGWEITTS